MEGSPRRVVMRTCLGAYQLYTRLYNERAKPAVMRYRYAVAVLHYSYRENSGLHPAHIRKAVKNRPGYYGRSHDHYNRGRGFAHHLFFNREGDSWPVTVLTDAHCHPEDLAAVFPQAEQERRRLGVTAAASACDMEEFAHNEELARNAAADGASPLLPCFAIHPQLPAVKAENGKPFTEVELNDTLVSLHDLASAGRIAAVGEFGFDLYNAAFRETEALQDKIFAAHLEAALRYNLPVTLHVRRAMHKIFAAAKILTKCRAVVFHSWSGTYDEGQSLLRRGVNAYFSFGNTVALNHKQAQKSCALFPPERLLTETDAPFQPLRGKNFSQWADLPLIIETAAALRCEAGTALTDAKELEKRIEANFCAVFKG